MSKESKREKIGPHISIEEAKLIAKQFRLLALAATLTLVLGSIMYHYLEDLRWIDAVYFSTVSLTTVGYGDFTPKTDLGKMFTIFYLILGIGIIAALINNVIKSAVARRVVKNHNNHHSS